MNRLMWPMSLQTVLALESMMQEMQDVPDKLKVGKDKAVELVLVSSHLMLHIKVKGNSWGAHHQN